MNVNTKMLLVGALALGLLTTGTAEAALVPVLLYDADGGTSNGTPSTLTDGTAIIDQSSAGNDGVTTNGLNGSGSGTVATVEDDPFGAAGELSFSFDGSSARIVTNSIDLLTDDVIAAAGGYTMSGWVKTSLADGNRSLLTFAGTDGLNLNGGDLDVIARRGNLQVAGPSVSDGDWHSFELRVDTSADPDGTANSTPGGGAADVHGLDGVVSLFLDGSLAATGAVTIGDFGDTLDRTIGVGGHTQGFGTTEFTGLLYNPSVSLGAIPEPSTMLLAFGALATLACSRKR